MSFPTLSSERLDLSIYFDIGVWNGEITVDLCVHPKSGQNNVIDYHSPENLAKIKDAVCRGLSKQFKLATISKVEIGSARTDTYIARIDFSDPDNPAVF